MLRTKKTRQQMFVVNPLRSAEIKVLDVEGDQVGIKSQFKFVHTSNIWAQTLNYHVGRLDKVTVMSFNHGWSLTAGQLIRSN